MQNGKKQPKVELKHVKGHRHANLWGRWWMELHHNPAINWFFFFFAQDKWSFTKAANQWILTSIELFVGFYLLKMPIFILCSEALQVNHCRTGGSTAAMSWITEGEEDKQKNRQCIPTGEVADSHTLYDKKVWVWVNCGGDKTETSSIQRVFQIHSGVWHKWQ